MDIKKRFCEFWDSGFDSLIHTENGESYVLVSVYGDFIRVFRINPNLFLLRSEFNQFEDTELILGDNEWGKSASSRAELIMEHGKVLNNEPIRETNLGLITV